MPDRFSFRCPACEVRLRAAIHHIGRSSSCPACQRPVTIPPAVPEECDPILVLDPGNPFIPEGMAQGG